MSAFTRLDAVIAGVLLIATCQAAQGGLEVWNRNLMAQDGEDASEKPGTLSPLTIAGARNGTFSGKVMVSGAGAGLKAAVSDLKAGAETIPAARVQVRYGVAWGADMPTRNKPRGRDVLLDRPPADASGTLEVWISVAVPKEAKAGTYTGQVTLQDTAGKVDVPVSLQVADWALPDTQDFRTWTELIQSPDTLAVQYDVPLWSPKHWDLIARSLSLLGQTGSRVLYVPLICHTNNGNAESMVRWARKGKEFYEYDFSIMDKYLDLAAKHMGTPKIIVLNAWESYQKPAENQWDEKWWNSLTPEQQKNSYFRTLKERGDETRKIQGEHGAGPAVTVVAAAAPGKTEEVYLPSFADARSKTQWKPLFDELRRNLAKRGLEKTMMLGMLSDYWPTKEEVSSLHDITGGLPWVVHSHNGHIARGQATVHDKAPLGYEACVFTYTYTLNPAKARTYGWKAPGLVAQYMRFGFFNTSPGATIRGMPEINISGMQRGVGRIGGDMWSAAKDKRGARSLFVNERFPQSQWRNLDLGSALLAPGPDGAVATARFEFLREGVQECEARIVIEDALTTPAQKATLGDALAAKAQAVLDERHRAIWKGRGISDADFESHGEVVGIAADLSITGSRGKQEPAGHKWFVNSGWQKRSADLYSLAGEVARALTNGSPKR